MKIATKILGSVMAVSLLISSAPLRADDPQPYTNINILPYVPYYLADGYLLNGLMNSLDATTFISVGTLDGAAARYVAQNTAEDVVIYAVSCWWSRDPSHKYTFQKFLSNVKQEGTAERIIPIRMTSQEAVKALNVIADVIYLDSCSETLTNDIISWFSHLSSNGAVAGNGWLDPYVEIAVSQAAASLGLVVSSSGNFWYIQK